MRSVTNIRYAPCLTVSPKLIRRSTNCHCPPKRYKLQFRLFLPSSSLHLLLVVALQGAVTWHYDHFFPFNLAKTKQRENLNLVLKDCHTNGQKFRFPKIAGKHDSCQTFSSKLYQAGLSFLDLFKLFHMEIKDQTGSLAFQSKRESFSKQNWSQDVMFL